MFKIRLFVFGCLISFLSSAEGQDIRQRDVGYDTDVEPIDEPFPEYTKLALLFNMQGWCNIEFDIGLDGKTLNPNILDCWPEAVFDEAALDVIWHYKYKPAMLNGKPVIKKGHEELIKFMIMNDQSNEARTGRLYWIRITTSMPDMVNSYIKEQKMLHTGMSEIWKSDIQPIFKVQPVYPKDALAVGLEGYCIVEFTVTEKGITADHEIVECTPSEIFALYSIAAAKQFLYLPELENGIPVSRKGVRNKINFRIEENEAPD